MKKLTYEELAIISDCILYRINEMYRIRETFSCYSETLENIDDAIMKLRELNNKISFIMEQN